MASHGAPLHRCIHACLQQLQRPGRLGLFWPLGVEPDLLHPPPQWPAGLALPRCQDDGLVYAAWATGDLLTPDTCNIPAPTGPALAADAMGLLLIPALAIDEDGLRLGSGGGWYDRLRAQKEWREIPTLAVLPKRCCGVQLPSDPWDIPLQGWINEAGLHWCTRSQC